MAKNASTDLKLGLKTYFYGFYQIPKDFWKIFKIGQFWLVIEPSSQPVYLFAVERDDLECIILCSISLFHGKIFAFIIIIIHTLLFLISYITRIFYYEYWIPKWGLSKYKKIYRFWYGNFKFISLCMPFNFKLLLGLFCSDKVVTCHCCATSLSLYHCTVLSLNSILTSWAKKKTSATRHNIY